MRTLKKRTTTNRKHPTLPSSLRPLGIITKVPRQPGCIVADYFTNQTVFAYRDADFDHLLPAILPASDEIAVSGYELTEFTTEANLIKVGKPFTNLKQIENLILRTEKSENTALIKNGYINIFFLEVGNSVFTVHAHRGSDGWRVNLDRFSARYGWRDGRRFFSPAT